MKKALITGIGGFAGSHLAEFLLSNKISVFGIYHPQHSIENLNSVKSSIRLYGGDLLNTDKIKEAVLNIKPDYVFHLAAFSSPSGSFLKPQETLKNNIVGQLNLLDPLAKIKSRAKILVIGSADEYGEIDEKFLPATENTPLRPNSPYAVSKVAQDMLGLQYYLHEKLNVVRVRPFNHIGPRQSTQFVISAFASQIALIEKKGGSIRVGNLETSRDFTDVRDMVRGYFLALEKGKIGDVYNLGSGKLIKISAILEMLLKLATVKIGVIVDKSRFSYGETRIKYCDYSKFKKRTGWEPKIPLSQTLSDTITYERAKLN